VSTTPIVGQEAHVVDTAVSVSIAVGAQRRGRPTDPEAGWAPGGCTNERLVLRDGRDGQRDVVIVRIGNALDRDGHQAVVRRPQRRRRCGRMAAVRWAVEGLQIASITDAVLVNVVLKNIWDERTVVKDVGDLVPIGVRRCANAKIWRTT